MTLLDTIRLALRNLAQAKLRSSLTMLGVSIGIASLAGMVSLGVGLQDQLVGRFMQSGMFDSITVTTTPIGGRMGGMGARGRAGRDGGAGPAGRADGAGAARPGGADSATPDPVAPRLQLNDDAIGKLSAIAEVKSVYPTLRVPLQVTFGDYQEFSAAAGVPMSAGSEGAFQTIAHGTFFANETDDACMLSLDMAKRISTDDPKNLIGKTLTLSYAIAAPEGQPGDAAPAGVPAGLAGLAAGLRVKRVEAPCPIAGIVERESAPGLGGGQVSALMIPLAKARAIHAVQVTNAQSLLRPRAEDRSYPSVTVKVTHAQHTQDVQDQIKALGYSAFSLNDALQGAKRAFLILDIVLSLIGSIALAVSSLGIVNTMVMSILERTREIGIMKAIGGSDRDIRKIFLIEASAIGLIGGVAGVVLGWLVGRVINFGANIYIENQGGTPGNLFSLPLWLIGGAIGFSLVVSLLAGSYPARRAARLDPIQALRHD